MPDYFPRGDGDKLNWLNNYNTKIGANGAVVGLTPAEISAIQTKIGAYLSQFNGLLQQKNALQATTAATRLAEKNLVADVRKQVGRLKTHAGYTQPIGEDLDVIGEDEAFDPDTFKPKLTATVLRVPDASTSASRDPIASNKLSAIRTPGVAVFASTAHIRSENSGCAFNPVPSAVPPIGNSSRWMRADLIRTTP